MNDSFPGALRASTRVAFLLTMAFIVGVHPVLAQAKYVVAGKQSEVTYSMQHPAHDWSGRTHQVAGAVVFDTEGHPTQIDIRIPVLSFDSENKNRDSHMAETVESYLFRDVSFHSTKIVVGRTTTGQQIWNIDGELTFHGIKRPLHSTAAVTTDENQLVSLGSFELALTPFGIDLPSLMMVKVKDWLKIDYRITAIAEHHPGT